MSNLSDGQQALEQLDSRVRRLGATLAELGWDLPLQQLADELPVAGEQLLYVGRLAETAATRVLNLVDAALPACQAAAGEAQSLAERLDGLATHPALGVGEARAVMAEAAAALAHQADVQRAQAALLTEIMMAQDFQDLSGQVIARLTPLVGLAQGQLQQLLAHHEGRSAPPRAGLAGPQLPEQALAQRQADELLASLGF